MAKLGPESGFANSLDDMLSEVGMDSTGTLDGKFVKQWAEQEADAVRANFDDLVEDGLSDHIEEAYVPDDLAKFDEAIEEVTGENPGLLKKYQEALERSRNGGP